MYKSFKKSCLILLSALVVAMLILACAFMLTPKTTANADEGNTGVVATVTFNGEVTEYDDIQDAWTYANYVNSSNDTPAVIKLFADVETKQTLSKFGSKVITLDLNGCILKYTGTSRVYSFIYLDNGGKFTLKDSNPNSTHYYTDNNGLWEFGEMGTEFKGGVLTGGDINGSGGGLRTFGEFVMESGSICGNKSSNAGGGVFVGADGVFTMSGGTICGNTAGNKGGGVDVFANGLFTVTGAPLIFGNTKTDNSNANVNLEGSHKITVTGELAEGAKIGISNVDKVITSGYGENNKDASNNIIAPDKYFVSDKDGYFPTLENGEVVLVEGVATVTVDSVETRYGSMEDAWTYANGATTAATVKMYADATISSTLEVAESKNITLDLNGHMLKYSNDAESGSVIKVTKSTFTLIDGNKTTSHTITSPVTNEEVTLSGGLITGSTHNMGGGVWVEGGTFTMNGGTISGNTVTNIGGGVCVETITEYNAETDNWDIVAYGTFTMNGGTITGNTAAMNGGGVVVRDAAFIMNGGTISGNAAVYYGGGVYVSDGTFTMTGGTISGNAANDGGGVFVFLGSMFTMENGTISGNTADDGGGVSVYLDSTFTMTDGTISGNTATYSGGGVHLYSNCAFTMTGGTITGNTADENGGGVYVCESSLKVSGTPKITDNQAGNTDNNVCLVGDNKITVTGELKEGAKIYITIYSESGLGDVATGFTQADKPSKYFIPDDAEKCVYLSDETSGTVTIGTHTFAEDFTVDTPATCTEAGSKSKHCLNCDEKTEVTEIPATGHTLTHHEATVATEEEDGNSEYWSCDECDKYFEDEAGETEITDKSSVVISKLTPVEDPTPTPDNNDDETPNGGLSAGAIAGIVIGIIVFLLLVAYVVCYFALYRKDILLKGKVFDVIYAPMNAICGKKEQDKEVEE